MGAACHRKPAPIEIIPDVDKNHLQRNHIFGNVKEIETSIFGLQEDSLTIKDSAQALQWTLERQPDRIFVHHYSYDGYMLDFYNITAANDTQLYRKYIYNDRAQISEWSETKNDFISSKGKYSYDRNHFISGEKIYDGDSLVMSFAYKTDGVGNIISSTQDNQQFVTTTKYHYNEHGLVDRIEEYEPSGKVFKSATIEYDNYGDEVNRCVYKSGKQLIEYTYNKYEQDGRKIKTIYEDKLHRNKEVKYYTSFDSHKNWIIEYGVSNNQLVSIRKRNINYYQ